MSISRPNGFQLVVFFCSSIPVVLFETPTITKCLTKLFLLSPYLCFIIDSTCNLFVGPNDSWMS